MHVCRGGFEFVDELRDLGRVAVGIPRPCVADRLGSKPTTATLASSGAEGNSAVGWPGAGSRRRPAPFRPIAAKAVTKTVSARIETIRRMTTTTSSACPPRGPGAPPRVRGADVPDKLRARAIMQADAPRSSPSSSLTAVPRDRGRALGGAAPPHRRRPRGVRCGTSPRSTRPSRPSCSCTAIPTSRPARSPASSAVPPDDGDDDPDAVPQRPRRAQRPTRAPHPDGRPREGSPRSQPTAKNIRASHVVSPSTRRARPAPNRRAARAFDVDHEQQLVARTHDAPEAHLLHATEQRELPCVSLVAEQRDRARLRERLELDHARERSGCPGSARRGSTRRR